MTTLIAKITLMTLSTVYIIDYSGVIVDISKYMHKLTGKGKPWMGQLIRKPFSCSECMTFWLTLILSIQTIDIVSSLALATAFGLGSRVIKNTLGVIINLINKIK